MTCLVGPAQLDRSGGARSTGPVWAASDREEPDGSLSPLPSLPSSFLSSTPFSSPPLPSSPPLSLMAPCQLTVPVCPSARPVMDAFPCVHQYSHSEPLSIIERYSEVRAVLEPSHEICSSVQGTEVYPIAQPSMFILTWGYGGVRLTLTYSPVQACISSK